MATFTIDSENNITGYAPGEAIPDGNTERFTTESELAELAAQWPAARLVELWNSIPGLTARSEVHEPENGGSANLESDTEPRV